MKDVNTQKILVRKTNKDTTQNNILLKVSKITCQYYIYLSK